MTRNRWEGNDCKDIDFPHSRGMIVAQKVSRCRGSGARFLISNTEL